MNRMVHIGSLICLSLLGACTALVGAEPTDLSKIVVGAERKDVEAATGGSPTTVRSEEYGQVAVYGINLGMTAGSPWFVECPYGSCLHPWFWPLIEYEARQRFETQRRKIEVILNTNEKVQFVRFVPGSLEPPEWLREKMTLERQAEAGDANAQFGLYLFDAPDIDRWYWLCVAANNGQPLAQIELARHYWSGIQPLKKNRVRSQMWYRLAKQTGYEAFLIEGHPREESLTIGQIAEAERLVAEWKPNPEECEVYANQADN